MELGVKHHTESQRNRGFGVWGLRPQIKTFALFAFFAANKTSASLCLCVSQKYR